MGWVTKTLSEGTLSRWSRLHLQSLAPTNPLWARVVGYGPFSLWLIHKEGLCPSSGDINRLMMILLTTGWSAGNFNTFFYRMFLILTLCFWYCFLYSLLLTVVSGGCQTQTQITYYLELLRA
jgi:hypothetical protein